jgi:hypothetical protein
MTSTKIETCFVISPFGEPFDTYFASIIRPAIERSGLYAVRGDSLYRPTTIVDDIWTGIKEAKLLIAELTNRNPNVFYELGLAHAISKPVVLISQSIEDVPFDLRGIRVILYDKDHPKWGDVLMVNIERALSEVCANPSSAIPTTFKDIVPGRAPEESEVIARIENLEGVIRSLSAALPQGEEGQPDLSAYGIDEYRDRGPYIPLSVGSKVLHKQFGRGQVIEVKPQHIAVVNFEKVGTKWINQWIARMQVIAGAA